MIGSWEEQISDQDCPAESCARFPSIVGLSVCHQARAAGADYNSIGDGDGDGDCDHCTYTSRLATSTSASKLPQT
jgi:hypothetical protein